MPKLNQMFLKKIKSHENGTVYFYVYRINNSLCQVIEILLGLTLLVLFLIL